MGFVVDVRPDAKRWLAVGRRQLPFPGDERDRYTSRCGAIAVQHGGAFSQFVEEAPDVLAARRAKAPEKGGE